MFLLLCIVHGLQFLTIRTTGKLRERARIAALKIAPLAIIALLILLVLDYGKQIFSLVMVKSGLWFRLELL